MQFIVQNIRYIVFSPEIRIIVNNFRVDDGSTSRFWIKVVPSAASAFRRPERRERHQEESSQRLQKHVFFFVTVPTSSAELNYKPASAGTGAFVAI